MHETTISSAVDSSPSLVLGDLVQADRVPVVFRRRLDKDQNVNFSALLDLSGLYSERVLSMPKLLGLDLARVLLVYDHVLLSVKQVKRLFNMESLVPKVPSYQLFTQIAGLGLTQFNV